MPFGRTAEHITALLTYSTVEARTCRKFKRRLCANSWASIDILLAAALNPITKPRRLSSPIAAAFQISGVEHLPKSPCFGIPATARFILSMPLLAALPIEPGEVDCR